MSADTTFAAPIQEKGADFPRLLMADYGTLEGICRQNRATQQRRLLDECGIKGMERYSALRESDTLISMGLVDLYLQTYDGAKKALSMSLARAGKTDEQATEIIAKFGITEASDLARELVGFIRRLDTAKTEAAPDPLPAA